MHIFGETIVLRAIEEKDNEMLRSLINDPDTERMIGGSSWPVSRDEQMDWYERQKKEKNVLRCIVVSLSGPILGREALGWFVDMSAIGASIGYFFTAASTLVTSKRDGDGTRFLKLMATVGVLFSMIFMILQLIPIPGLSGVHFGKESYIMLIIWVLLGVVFYLMQRKKLKS